MIASPDFNSIAGVQLFGGFGDAAVDANNAGVTHFLGDRSPQTQPASL